MKTFSISNFKSFATKQTIPIKPITLIYGANSAGKSSIIHSYLLLNNILKTGKCDVNVIKTLWDSVDIGGFKQYVNKHDYEKSIEFRIQSKTENLTLVLTISTDTGDDGELLGIPASVHAIEILHEDESLFRFTRNLDKDVNHLFSLRAFNFDNFMWITFSKSEISGEKTLNLDFSFDFNRFISSHRQNYYNASSCVNCFISKENEVFDDNPLALFICNILNKFLIPVWDDNTANSRSAINYVGPLRDYPPRVISDEQTGEDKADHTWDILLKSEDVRTKINNWIGNEKVMSPAYELKIEKKINPETVLAPLVKLLSEINIMEGTVPPELESIINVNMDDEEDYDVTTNSEKTENLIRELLEDKKNLDFYTKLILFDKNSDISVSLRDVGVGISQVLPVLVNAYSPDNNVVAVEQPEIHLHPKLQSELADVFIETALGEEKKTYLIETHSEHLLLRIMRRIRQTTNGDLPKDKTPIKAQDVQILFVKEGRNVEGSVIKKIALDDDGELKDRWPGGFFEEGFEERFGL